MLILAFAAFCILYYLIGGVAIGLGLHRLLTHRSFALPKLLERIVVTLSLPAGTPIQWVGNHRFHHAHTDEPEDPHSPHVSGFWYAHVGWYLGTSNPVICSLYSVAGPLRMLFDGIWRPRTNQQYLYLAKDVERDPYYAWVSKPLPYLVMMWVHIAIVFGIAYGLAGWIGVACLWLQVVWMYNACDAIDSVAHLFGSKPYSGHDQSRNNWILGWLTLGEGWHANHHAFPQSARHGLLPRQFDWTWLTICGLKRLGLARDIVLPTEGQLLHRLEEKL